MITLITLVTLILLFVLAAVVYTRNQKSVTHRYLVLFTFLLFLWTVTNYFALNFPVIEARLFWVRMVMFVTAPIPAVFFLLAHVYPHMQHQLPRKMSWGLLLTTLVVMVLTPWTFREYQLIDGQHHLTPGPAIAIYGLSFLGFSFLAVLTLVRKYRQAKGLQKTQIYYFLLGLILTVLLGFLTNFVFVVLLNNLSLTALGPMFSLIMIGSLTYAIIRHRFLDIKLFFVRSLAYLLFVGLIALLYSFSLFSISKFFVVEQNSSWGVITTIVLIFIITLAFQPLLSFLERMTRSIFYRSVYNSQALLQQLSEVMSSHLGLQELVELVLRDLQSAVKISSAQVVVNNNKKILTIRGLMRAKKVSAKDLFQLAVRAAEQSPEKILVFDELPELPFKQELRTVEISVVLPLIVKEEVIGGLVLGELASGEMYSSSDIDVLKIIASQFAIAIKNALSYEEIRNFSHTLEKEVDRATHKLRDANRRLKQLDELKDEFVSIASHELRTPMTAIKSYIWLSLNHLHAHPNAKIHRYLTVAYSSTERLIRLVQDMLTISRIEGKYFELRKSLFDPKIVVKETYDELKIKAAEKKITFVLEEPTESFSLYADKEKLHEVVQNIASNALKFTPEKGQVQLVLGRKTGKVFFKVIDNGPGIPKNEIPHIFEKFSRLEDSYVTNPESGTGLGLYIAKQIIDLHQGSIDVKSEISKGTTFTISLPGFHDEVKETSWRKNRDQAD